MIIFEIIIAYTILIGIPLFIIVSLILFIYDGIDAKKEGRSRKKIYTVMFIISMAIVGIMLIIGILLWVFRREVMWSM